MCQQDHQQTTVRILQWTFDDNVPHPFLRRAVGGEVQKVRFQRVRASLVQTLSHRPVRVM